MVLFKPAQLPLSVTQGHWDYSYSTLDGIIFHRRTTPRRSRTLRPGWLETKWSFLSKQTMWREGFISNPWHSELGKRFPKQQIFWNKLGTHFAKVTRELKFRRAWERLLSWSLRKTSGKTFDAIYSVHPKNATIQNVLQCQYLKILDLIILQAEHRDQLIF